MNEIELIGITRVVKNFERSRKFYEDVLEFKADAFYEPTKWQSYKVQDGLFYAIGEEPGSTNAVTFAVSDIESLWKKVKDKAEVVSPLEKTSWGTFRFMIKDLDGNLLAFRPKKQ